MARRWGRTPRVTAATLAVAGLVTAAMTGCSALSGSASTSSSSITLYSGQHPQTTQKLVAAFEKQTGIKVSVRSDDEDVLAAQIVTEGKNSPADAFYTENTPPLEFLQGKGLLSGVRSSTLAATPAKYNSPHGDWVGVSARVSVLVYNPSLISESQLPTSVMQLADPNTGASWPWPPGRLTSSRSSPRSCTRTAPPRPRSGSRPSRRTRLGTSTRTTRP